MKTVLVVGSSSYYKPFKIFGNLEKRTEVLLTNPERLLFIVFTGGEDVTPSFYGESPNPKTYNNIQRDISERRIFEAALEASIPMAGICRGAQFLCAMAGGKLVQHITNHGSNHNVRTNDGRLIEVTSTHHQMQLPPVGAEIIAWAEPNLSRVYEGPYNPPKEFDCVYYPNIKALGMQYHPEYMDEDSEGFKYCQELTAKYIVS